MNINLIPDLYLTELSQALSNLDRQSIWCVIDELMRAWRDHQQIFLIGNGGSAATASHMANDLNKIALAGQPRLRAIALTDNVPLITAWANDAVYESIFAEQLRNLCQAGDVVIAVSCSGNSPNVLLGVQVARELGARVIGFTGNVGGQLRQLVDICVYAPATPIGQQEDIHLALDHLITTALTNWIASIASSGNTPVKALLLAAGEGTRLKPLTLDRPKPMLPIAGKPLMQISLEWLQRYKIRNVAINLHYRPEVITQYFGDGSGQNMDIIYSQEDPILGTAGAARKLKTYLSDAPFLVVYGDVLTDLDLNALLSFHYEKAARDPATGVTLSLYHVPNPTEVGLVGMDQSNKVTRFVEKPAPDQVFTDLANAGVMVIEPRVLDKIPADTYYDFGHHLLPRLLQEGISIYGWIVPYRTYLLDIGSPEKYEQAQREWPRHSLGSRL